MTEVTVKTRRYDRPYNRVYGAAPLPPPPPAPPAVPEAPPPGLAGITWSGLDINPGNLDDGFTADVENCEGWYGSPPLNGNDAERALADGGSFGRKLLGAREITLSGKAAGPRSRLMRWRDELAARAAARQPAELAVTDPWLGTTLTAMTRADSESFRHEFFAGGYGFRWGVTLYAADPLLYEAGWHQAVLTTSTDADAGRVYDRQYEWAYGSPDPAGSAAYLPNDGNADAPVLAVWEGDLSASRVGDGGAYAILAAPLAAGVQVAVDTGSLDAWAPAGGESRAEFVQPGSRPLTVPASSVARWHLYATGSGSVTLSWRSAWL